MEHSSDSIYDYLDNFNSFTNFSLCYINARSICNKFDNIELLVKRLHFPHILVISETWLSPGEEKFYDLFNYKASHIVRNYKGGGVSV